MPLKKVRFGSKAKAIYSTHYSTIINNWYNCSVSQQDVADWDDWDYAGAPTSIVVEPNDPNLAQQQVDLNQPAEDIPEMDYFSDMAPTMKRTVCIIALGLWQIVPCLVFKQVYAIYPVHYEKNGLC